MYPNPTREQVENLAVGDYIIRQINGRAWQPEQVVEIHARGNNHYTGLAYVCFYTQWSENGRMSGSMSEWENFAVVVPVIEEEKTC